MKVPSVMVLPVDNSVGLAVARALGREGVPVHGVSYSADGYGLRSRYLTGRHVLAGPAGSWVPRLLDLVRTERPDFLMVHGEANLRAINTHRAEFEKFTKPLFAPQDVLDRAFDKSQTLAIARRIGIPVPQSYSATSPCDVERLAESVSFPVVAKPPRPYEEAEHAHFNFGYRIIRDKCQFIEFLRPYAAAPFYPLIQEYCPGHGVGIETCMYKSTALAVFQHRRIREFPISGGPSVYRRSEPVDAGLASMSIELLRAMKWDGVAMVEFRHDPLKGGSVLMEVNGRFWGSLPLAIHSGVNFPHLLYLAHGLGTPKTVGAYHGYRYCRQLSADTKWLLAVLRGRSGEVMPCGRLSALSQYMRAFVQCRHFDIEWADDLAPAWSFWMRFLKRPTKAKWNSPLCRTDCGVQNDKLARAAGPMLPRGKSARSPISRRRGNC